MHRAALALLAALSAFPAAAHAVPPVYVTNQGSGTMSAFRPAADGALTPIGAPVATGASPAEIAITPDGRFAYVANSTAPGTVSVFAVAPDGGLAALGAPVPTGGNNPNALAVAAGGTRLYVTNGAAGSSSVTTLAIGADGALAAVGAPVPSGGIVPRAVVAAPDGSHLYVANNSTSTITTFALGGNGEPVQQGASLDPPGHDTFDLAISPGGDRLYVANFGTNDVTTLAVGADGSLTPLGDPVATGATMPRSLALSGDGTRMLVTNRGAPKTVSLFSIGADGRPSVTGAPTPVADEPSGVAFSPNGALGFVAGSTGTLTPFSGATAGSPAATGGTQPRGVAVRPGQGPTAAFSITAGRAGAASAFDASASSDPDGSVAGQLWSFGDGTPPAGGAKPKHVYAKPGTFTVTLTVVDDDGCSAARTFTGRTVACNGSPGATAKRTVVVGPAARATPSVKTTKASLSRTGRVTLRLACATTAVKRCAGRLTLAARLPGKKKAQTIGSASFSVKVGKRGAVVVALTNAARAALARRGLAVTARLSTTQPSGPNRVSTRSVKLVR